MYSQIHYLLRSNQNGRYLAARPRIATQDPDQAPQTDPGFLLIFQEHADALSYLNTHAGEIAPQFTVESIPGSQLSNMLNRWGYTGIGLVKDPLMPNVEFLRRQ